MTGKEALNLLFCTSEGLPEDKVYECKKILEKELEELTKYKRAFEILKERINIYKENLYKEKLTRQLAVAYRNGEEVALNTILLLLEELMGNENC